MTPKLKTTDLLAESTIEDLKQIFEITSQSRTSKYEFPLVKAPFGFDEVLSAIDSLLSTDVTMGRKVFQFEEAFEKYIGVKHAIMVNSGSSANLLALAALANPETEDCISPGGKIIVPALTWSTSVYPILDIGCIPVFVDSDEKTLNLDIGLIRKAIDNDTRAIVAVHLIGNPCALEELREIADDHNLFLVEDCCEAHGAEFNSKKVGSYGKFGTFSFFFSHHITTIEGGMIVTDDDNLAEMCRCLRAHGWTRHLDEREKVEKQYPERDPRFLFINRGYNLRPTDLQGAFGNCQLQKLDGFVDIRRKNASVIADRLIQEGVQVGTQMEQPEGKHSWFGFPLILQEASWERRAKVIHDLEKASVETRPIMSGNMADQPAMKLFKHEVKGPLSVARKIDVSGLFVGLNQNMADEEANELANRIIISLNEGGV